MTLCLPHSAQRKANDKKKSFSASPAFVPQLRASGSSGVRSGTGKKTGVTLGLHRPPPRAPPDSGSLFFLNLGGVILNRNYLHLTAFSPRPRGSALGIVTSVNEWLFC